MTSGQSNKETSDNLYVLAFKVVEETRCTRLKPSVGCDIMKAFRFMPQPNKEKDNMVRQAKLGRTNRMKGICTAKKTTCR